MDEMTEGLADLDSDHDFELYVMWKFDLGGFEASTWGSKRKRVVQVSEDQGKNATKLVTSASQNRPINVPECPP